MSRTLSTCRCFDSGCARYGLTAVAFLGAEPASLNISEVPVAIGILAVQGFVVSEDGRKHNLSLQCSQTESKLVLRKLNEQNHACNLLPFSGC